MAHVTQAGTSVLDQLGLAAEDVVKAKLALRIAKTIAELGLSQREAAALMPITQPKLSAVAQGRLNNISQVKLEECLRALGHDIEITIGPAPRGRGRGAGAGGGVRSPETTRARARLEALRGKIARGRESGSGIPAEEAFAAARAWIGEAATRLQPEETATNLQRHRWEAASDGTRVHPDLVRTARSLGRRGY